MMIIKNVELELRAAQEANAQLREHQHAEQLAAALEAITVKWLQLHAALSEALGLECLPDEDAERYTERIAEIKATLKPFADAYDVYTAAWGHDMHPDLDLAEIENARYSKVLTFSEFQAAKKAYSGDVKA